MTRHQRIAAYITEEIHQPASNDRQGYYDYQNNYLSIGHGKKEGNYGEDQGYLLWAYIDGEIEVKNPYTKLTHEYMEETHNMRWDWEVLDKTFKGRYEPKTGKLSVVVPERFRHRGIPNIVMRTLEYKFNGIQKISVFYL